MSYTVDDPILELDDVSVHYSEPPLMERALPESILDRFDIGEDPVKALTDVSLQLGEEDVIVLVGESGSGKSTLGRTAIGLQEPTHGTVSYKGYNIEEIEAGKHTDEILYEDVRKSMQIVHQDPSSALNPYRTVRSSLSQPLKIWYPEMDMNDRRERILQLLKVTGVTPAQEYLHRYPHELSGGEQQRVAIIRAMLVEPDIILADEIVSALDVSLRVNIMDLLLELQDMFGTSYLFISHNLTNARYIASKADGRIAVMYLGNIVEIGPVEQILEDPKHPYTKVLKWASLPLDNRKARETITDETPVVTTEPPDVSNPPSGCRFHVACPKAREVCPEESPELMSEESSDEHLASCFREDPNHRYWNSEELHNIETEITF